MYCVRTPGYDKLDPVMRWGLPDRVFFACGACHILAYAFLERYGHGLGQPLWIRPDQGFSGNHIFISASGWTFDHHGYAGPGALVAHHTRRARRRLPGWGATLVPLPPDVLTDEARSRAYPGLWLRGPENFLHDPLPRARRYLDRFPAPSATL